MLYLHDVPLYLEENPDSIQGIGEPACFGPYLPLQSCLSLPLAWFQSQQPCRSLNTPSSVPLWAFGHGAPLPGMLFSSLCPYVAGSFLFLRINGISSEASPDPPVSRRSLLYSPFCDTYHNLKLLHLCMCLLPACLRIKQNSSCMQAETCCSGSLLNPQCVAENLAHYER